MAIHKFYLQVTAAEDHLIREAVQTFMRYAQELNIPVCGDDRVEYVAEAMARCIVESRTP